MSLETVAHCPICGDEKLHKEFDCTDFTSTRENFTIQSCDTCNFLLTSPRPSEISIGKYYESTSYISHSTESKNLLDKIYFRVRRTSLKKKKKIITSQASKGKLLDIGCGTGEFIKYLHDDNWQVAGVEPSAKANQIANEKNLKIVKQLDEITEGDFNAITLWHVLEHIHKLDPTIKKIKDLLHQDGTIFIAVPNHESFDAKFYQEFWAAYDVPRHLWHFKKKNIQQLLENHNLKLISVYPMKFDSFYVSLLSEKYKHPNAPFLIQMIKAFFLGLVSNLKAKISGNYSSLIYVAKKS